MRTKTVIVFAWKNLWSHKLRALLTIGGMAIGMGAILFLVAIGFGLERLVTGQVANFEAYRILDVPSANLKTGKINQESIDRIKKVSHIVSIDEIVDMAGRVRLSNGNSTTETVVVAAQPSYFKLSDIGLKKGKTFSNNSEDQIVVSKTLADILVEKQNYKNLIGKTITLNLFIAQDLRKADSIEGPIEKEISNLKIVGVSDDSQDAVLYIPLNIAIDQGAINRTSLKIKLDTNNEKTVEITRKAIENIGFSTEYVGDTIKQITQVFSFFRIILAGFGLIALIVAILGTFNTLTISLMERIREVGLLKTLGMKQRGIFKLFITESLSIGILGGIVGLTLGQSICCILNMMMKILAERAGADPVTIAYTPLPFLIYMTIGSVFVGFATGFYPAYRAIKTSPLNALRYE